MAKSSTPPAADADATSSDGLPKAIILEADQPKSDRKEGAVYVERELFDLVARVGGYGAVDHLPSDASLDLSGLKGKAREQVTEILSGLNK